MKSEILHRHKRSYGCVGEVVSCSTFPIPVGRSHRPFAASRGGKAGSERIPCGNRLQDQQDRQILENAVKVIYDKETDTLSIILRPGKVAESDEPRPGLILDYDKAGRLVSIELLDASEQVKGPQSVEFALAAGG